MSLPTPTGGGIYQLDPDGEALEPGIGPDGRALVLLGRTVHGLAVLQRAAAAIRLHS